jgi:ATP-binding cassette subfamily B protein
MNEDFMHEDKVHASITYLELFRKVWIFCRPHKKLFAVVVFCVVGLAVSSRSLPFLIGYAIDKGVLQKDLPLLVKIAFAYLFVQIIQTSFQFLYAYVFQVFGNRVLFDIRSQLVRHVQALPIQYFNKTPVGRVVTRLTNDVSTLAELFTDGVVTIFVEFVILFSIIISMMLISWKLALMTLALSPIFIWASVQISNRIRDILRDAKKKLSTLNSFVAENLNGIKVIQITNRIPRNQQRFNNLSSEYKELTQASIRMYASMHPVMNLFNAVTVTTALYFGGFFHLESGLAIGSVVAFLMHVQDFINPMREILEKFQQFQNSITSGERVFQIFQEIPEEQKAPVIIPKSWQEKIEFRHLNFKYEEHLPLVLKDLNLSIEPGESVAIVGRTGSGKSTLISLLQRFYPAPENSLFIGGVPIESIPYHELRRHVGVVQQDPFIFRGSVLENITMLSSEISREIAVEACRKTGYMELLERSGRNLDSPVDERGANLSVGERQLIAFARILAFSPDILILDEATANIDSQTEQILQAASFEVAKGRTSIFIAHRLSTIRNCDRIIVLDHGVIQEMGTHSELISRKGLYYQVASAGEKSTVIVSSALGTEFP